MSNRQQRRAAGTKNQEIQLSPEQQAQLRAEQEMLKFIEDNGIEAMIAEQTKWKLNDIKAKIAASSNIKAWFETAYEVIDLRDKGLLDKLTLLENADIEEVINHFNGIKIALYNEIAVIYESLTPEVFLVDDFENPFGTLWSRYENKRSNIEDAIKELYAWSLCEDPVLWASGVHQMAAAHMTSNFTEEETD